jgi:hypothetical protein
MTAPLAAPARGNAPGPAAVPWPADDVVILRNRPVRLGTPSSRMSRFGDQVWHVQRYLSSQMKQM